MPRTLPIAGHPMNHSALLTTPQVDELRGELADPTDEWAGFAPATAEGRLCLASAERLSERHAAPARRVDPYAIPNEFGPVMSRTTSSQDAFARVLQDIANVEEVARNRRHAQTFRATATRPAPQANKSSLSNYSCE